MKILFSARPAYGHVYPLMPLALAARAAGHEVGVATTGAFLPRLAALGFETFDVGLTIEQGVERALGVGAGDVAPKSDDGRPELEFGVRLFVDVLARATASGLTPVLRRFAPDLVVYEQFEVGAPIAAHAAGIAAVCHAISPRTSTTAYEHVASGPIARLWAEHGLSNETFDVFTGARYVDIVPDALQPSTFLDEPARLPMRPLPYAEPGLTVPAWTRTCKRPIVYLTLGTVVASDDQLLPAIEGLATLDVELLVALGSADGARLVDLPANVHVEAFVDQATLIGRVQLVVHHGGTGTLLAALAAGTPQLLLPKGADQFLNADAVAAADLATVVEPADATPAVIAKVADEALRVPRPAAERVRAEIAARPAPSEVLATLVADREEICGSSSRLRRHAG